MMLVSPTVGDRKSRAGLCHSRRQICPWLLSLCIKSLRRIVAEDIDHLDENPVLAWFFVSVGVGGKRELAVLAGAIGHPPLHEGVVAKVPVNGPIIDVVGPLPDFAACFFG